MTQLIDFLVFFWWFLRASFFLWGMFCGAVVTLILAPVLYRWFNRRMMRRHWRRDAPLKPVDGLYPEWQPYDPAIPGIDRRCVCHGRKIPPGERVLMWPSTGPLDVLHMAVYCESAKEQLWDAR